MIQLKTRWAEGITAENVHQEYPRQMLVRDSFFNLNGEWEYGISQSAEIETVSYTHLTLPTIA